MLPESSLVSTYVGHGEGPDALTDLAVCSTCREGFTYHAIKGAPASIKGPPALANQHQNSIFALALETLADPCRYLDPRRSDALGDCILTLDAGRFIYQLATYKCATISEHAEHGSPIHTRKLDP